MKRRDFLKSPAAISALMGQFGFAAGNQWEHEKPPEPLVRHLYLQEQHDGKLLIVSDGSPNPRPLIKPNIIEEIWGPGAYSLLRQPLHWQMIDSGWFSEDDLWYPFNEDCEELDIWNAFYHPVCEAHDIVCRILGISSIFIMKSSRSDLGLQVAEHPSTPRYATAKLYNRGYIHKFVSEVHSRTKHVIVSLPE